MTERAYPITGNEWANQAVHHLEVALESAERHGDYDTARFDNEQATVLALLAIAQEIRTQAEKYIQDQENQP